MVRHGLLKGPSEAGLFRRLQLTASDPSRSPVGFKWIPRFALLALERAPSFAAGGRHQNQSGPAFGASRSFGLSHDTNLPLDLAARPFQIRGAGKNNSAYLYVANGRQSRAQADSGNSALIRPGVPRQFGVSSIFLKAAERARRHGCRTRAGCEALTSPRCDCPGEESEAPSDRSCWRSACWLRDDQ
jgi:hypothetical protein